MAGKGRCDLQRRLEGGETHQDVIIFSFGLQGVDCGRLAADSAARPALEAAVRHALAKSAGHGVAPEHVAFALTQGAWAEVEEEEGGHYQGDTGFDEAPWEGAEEGQVLQHGDEQQAQWGEEEGHWGEAQEGHGYDQAQGEYWPQQDGENPDAYAPLGDEWAQQAQDGTQYAEQHHGHSYEADGVWKDGGGGEEIPQTMRLAYEAGPQLMQGKEAVAPQPVAKRALLGAVLLQCAVTPAGETQASAVLAALKAACLQGAASLRGALVAAFAAAPEGLRDLAPALEVADVVPPEVRRAAFPGLQLGSKHGLPIALFTLFESLQVLDDARVIKLADGGFHATGAEALSADEITWALRKSAEVFKDVQLSRLFVLIISNLQKKDRHSCNQWASAIPPTTLRNILYDNPVKQRICGMPMGAHQQQEQLKAYMAGAKAVVAVAAVAGDLFRHWEEDFAAPDKAFLGDAAGKLGAWPDLSVALARGLWERSSCRYIVIDGLARSQRTSDAALVCLRRCPGEILRSRFKASWRSSAAKEASFFHLYDSFSQLSERSCAEDLVECLIKAYSEAPADLSAALKTFVEDWELERKVKQDFLISFVSECEYQKFSPPLPVSGPKCCLRKPARPKEEARPPLSTQGTAVMMLDVVLAAYMAQDGRGSSGSVAEGALVDMFEVALLISSGDELWDWGQRKVQEEPREAESARGFLRTVGLKYISSLLLVAACASKASLCDDARARELIGGTRQWTHDGRKLGRFSKHAEVVARRSPDDFAQLLRMYLKLDLAVDAGSAWRLVQALEGECGCKASRFNQFAPEGGGLRASLAVDVRRGLGVHSMESGQIEALLTYYAFFSAPMLTMLRGDHVLGSLRASIPPAVTKPQREGLVFSLLEVLVKIVSLNKGRADQDVQGTVMDICGQCQSGGAVTWRLLGKVLEAVQGGEFGEGELHLAYLCDCAKELGKAGQLLERKLAKGGAASAALLDGAERAITAALAQAAPASWAGSLRSLDTVIFTLEYMGKEDLQLAMERFKLECRRADHRKRLLWDLLATVNQIYTAPLAGTSLDDAAANMDMKEFIQKIAPRMAAPVWWRGVVFKPEDWGYVLEIAGAAAESMKKRYNVVMIPHHTQMITLLMFAVRACGVLGVAKATKLPRTMLARVGTGEGKSLIIGMLAAFVAKKGLRAHVVNDNRVLTRRDFQTNASIFEALGLRASSDPRDVRDQEVMIVYCSGDDVEAACLQCLTEGRSSEYEEELRRAVLIVDEVDGLIFDKGPTSAKEFEDREFSEWVSGWLGQLETNGRIERDWDDFRSQGEFSIAIQKEVENAYNEAFEKKEGRDFAERGKALYMLDPKTHMVREEGWALWLEILRRNRTGQNISYKYVKAILCRLQCFMSYSCIFGLTGSLGQSSEKTYLLDHYDAVTFNVPFFLDTCRSDEGSAPVVGSMVKITGEDGDPAGQRNRAGTKGSAGVITGHNAAQRMYTVDLGDGQGLRYAEGCVTRTSAGKRPQVDVGPAEPLRGASAQEEAVVSLAATRCAQVPVLVVAKDSDAVRRLAETLRARLGAAYGQGTGGVLELLHNPRNPKEFVDLVELATEPLPLGDTGGGAGVAHAWRVTLTTAEGGRGHDYRVVDPVVDDRGGMLLILTWVPWSEREWIQFLGRTGRQDRAGQYAVLLDAEAEQVRVVAKERRSGETLPQTILRHGDEETARKLVGMGEEIAKARLMHRLTSQYWKLHKQERTDKRQDWEWKRLCQDYARSPNELIIKKFLDVIPKDDWDADFGAEDGEAPEQEAATPRVQRVTPRRPAGGGKRASSVPANSLAELTCGKCGHVSFLSWTPGRSPPQQLCEQCGGTTILSSVVPVFGAAV